MNNTHHDNNDKSMVVVTTITKFVDGRRRGGILTNLAVKKYKCFSDANYYDVFEAVTSQKKNQEIIPLPNTNPDIAEECFSQNGIFFENIPEADNNGLICDNDTKCT